jgi:hypothetical protein
VPGTGCPIARDRLSRWPGNQRAGSGHERGMWAMSCAAAVAAIAVAAAAGLPALGRHASPGGAAPGRPPATAAAAALPSCQVTAPGQCQQARTYIVGSPLHALAVTDRVGQVTITGDDRSTVSVTEHVTYGGPAPDMRSTVSGGTLLLGYSCRSANCGVAYDIQVPRWPAIGVTTGVGAVRLTSLAGPVQVTTGTGAIRGQDLSGSPAHFATSVGSVSAMFSAVPGRVTADVGTGSVALQMPASASYTVTANAGIGAVSVGVPRAASSGHVIQARTNVGSITVTGG